MIFTFGSNLAGRHGKGAAKIALLYYGAKYGQGWGLQGNSFGIPTKDANLKVLPLEYIESYVNKFLDFSANSDYDFKVTRIGCGLAGYRDEQIAPMFLLASDNCYFDVAWKPYLNGRFWNAQEESV